MAQVRLTPQDGTTGTSTAAGLTAGGNLTGALRGRARRGGSYDTPALPYRDVPPPPSGTFSGEGATGDANSTRHGFTFAGDDQSDEGGNGVPSAAIDPATLLTTIGQEHDAPEGAPLTVTKVNGAGANVGSPTPGAYGDLTLNDNGSYTYDVDRANTALTLLAPGASVTDVFTYAITDDGKSETAILTVTITGTDQGPTASAHTDMAAGTSPGGVKRADSDADDDVLLLTQVVGSDDTIVGSTMTGMYGELSLSSDGSHSYKFDEINGDLIGLGTDEGFIDRLTHRTAGPDIETDGRSGWKDRFNEIIGRHRRQ